VNAKVDARQELAFEDELRTSRALNPNALLDVNLRGRRLLIDNERVVFGKRTIATGEVTAVRFTDTTLYVNGLGNFHKRVRIVDGSRKIEIECAGLTGNRRSELMYQAVSNAIWSAVCAPMLERWGSAVFKGNVVWVGRVGIGRDGLIVRRMLRGDGFCSWSSLTSKVENGKLYLGSGRDGFLAKIDLNTQDNALVLHAMVRAMSTPVSSR
jgi:hypothetical protein